MSNEFDAIRNELAWELCEYDHDKDKESFCLGFDAAVKLCRDELDKLRAEIERCKEIADRDGKDYCDLKAENKRLRTALEEIKDAATKGDETTTEIECHHIAENAL